MSEFIGAWELANVPDQLMHFVDNVQADAFTALCGKYVPVRASGNVWSGSRCDICEGIRLAYFGEMP